MQDGTWLQLKVALAHGVAHACALMDKSIRYVILALFPYFVSLNTHRSRAMVWTVSGQAELASRFNTSCAIPVYGRFKYPKFCEKKGKKREILSENV